MDLPGASGVRMPGWSLAIAPNERTCRAEFGFTETRCPIVMSRPDLTPTDRARAVYGSGIRTALLDRATHS
jgi:hypothetical protein